MILRFLGLAMVSVLLAGCVLQSETPLVSAGEGELALGSHATRFAAYSLKEGTWHKEDGTADFTPEGDHFLVKDSTSSNPGIIVFKSLAGKRWLMQMQGDDHTAAYALAEIDEGAVYPTPVMCTDVTKIEAFKPLVEVIGTDCKLAPAAPKAAVFSALASFPLTRNLKMVPIP